MPVDIDIWKREEAFMHWGFSDGKDAVDDFLKGIPQ